MCLFPPSLRELFLTPYLVSEEWREVGGESLYPVMSMLIKQTCLRTKAHPPPCPSPKKGNINCVVDNGQTLDLITSEKTQKKNMVGEADVRVCLFQLKN